MRKVQILAVAVSFLVIILYGNLLLAENPDSTLVGYVVTAIEQLREEKILQKERVLLAVGGVALVLLASAFYLIRRYDVPVQMERRS